MFLIVLAFSLLWTLPGLADTWSTYGIGAAHEALSNATVADPLDAFSQLDNVALPAMEPATNVSFSYVGAFPNFQSIDNVVVDTPELGASSTQTGSVQTNTSQDNILAIAGQTAINAWHVAAYLILPIPSMVDDETQDAFIPQYGPYLSDPTHLGLGASVSRALGDQWFVGLGSDIYFKGNAAFKVSLPSPGTSTSKLSAQFTPAFSLNAGTVCKISDALNLGFAYKSAKDYSNQINVDNLISVLGSTHLLFTTTGSLYYDPETWTLGAKYSWPFDDVMATARYENWQGFQSTRMNMAFQSWQTSFSQSLPDETYRNVVDLLVGYAHHFHKWVARVGYGYKPTPVPGQDGSVNILDSDKHVVGLGAGLKTGPWNWDAGVFAQFLETKTITKAGPEEIGYPGYTIGGTVYGVGLSASTEIR